MTISENPTGQPPSELCDELVASLAARGSETPWYLTYEQVLVRLRKYVHCLYQPNVPLDMLMRLAQKITADLVLDEKGRRLLDKNWVGALRKHGSQEGLARLCADVLANSQLRDFPQPSEPQVQWSYPPAGLWAVLLLTPQISELQTRGSHPSAGLRAVARTAALILAFLAFLAFLLLFGTQL